MNLKTCAAVLKGSSAGQLPSQVSRKKTPMRAQNISCLTGHQVEPRMFFLVSMNGRTPRMRIARKRAITPPSLFGIARRIAYTQRKYHSGLMCGGVTSGLAGMKFSGSRNRSGSRSLMRSIRNRAVAMPTRSFHT